MTDTDPARYGQTWAPIYDDVFGALDPTPAVNALYELAVEAGGQPPRSGRAAGE